MSIVQLSELHTRDDSYYSQSFGRLREQLTAWCVGQAKNLNSDAYELPVDVFTGNNSGFRICLLQSYIARYLSDVVFVEKCSMEMLAPFFDVLGTFSRQNLSLSSLRDQIMLPSITLAREMASEERILATAVFAAGTSYDPAVHEASILQASGTTRATVIFTLFPTLVVKETRLVVLSKAPTSLAGEWKNLDLTLPESPNPVMAIALRQPRQSRKMSNYTDGPSNKGNVGYVSSFEKGPDPIYAQNATGRWKKWTIALAVLCVALAIGLVGGIAAVKSSSSTKLPVNRLILNVAGSGPGMKAQRAVAKDAKATMQTYELTSQLTFAYALPTTGNNAMAGTVMTTSTAMFNISDGTATAVTSNSVASAVTSTFSGRTVMSTSDSSASATMSLSSQSTSTALTISSPSSNMETSSTTATSEGSGNKLPGGPTTTGSGS